MWDIRRSLNTEELPDHQVVLQFDFVDIDGPQRRWWLLAGGDQADICMTHPEFEVDLYVESTLGALTGYWVGHHTCSPPELPDPSGIGAVNSVLDDFHQAASDADEERRFGHLAPSGVSLGTGLVVLYTIDTRTTTFHPTKNNSLLAAIDLKLENIRTRVVSG